MVPEEQYIDNLRLALSVQKAPGAVVECGVWKGGMVAGIAAALGKSRRYYLFDSFEGLPPADDIDGPLARQWQNATTAPSYHNNCRADETDARRAMKLSAASAVTIMKGRFENTLQSFPPHERIAVLRLDADWYRPTSQCLSALHKNVCAGGVIIVDDYYTWDGCSRAVHDFLSRHNRAERIQHTKAGVCYLVRV